jgi:hypothetical protein
VAIPEAAQRILKHTGAAAMKARTDKSEREHHESVRVRSGRGRAHCAMGRGIEPNVIPTTCESFDGGTCINRAACALVLTKTTIANAKFEFQASD